MFLFAFVSARLAAHVSYPVGVGGVIITDGYDGEKLLKLTHCDEEGSCDYTEMTVPTNISLLLDDVIMHFNESFKRDFPVFEEQEM